MADAIYLAKGGADTRYPYGIKSLRMRDLADAREITIRSILSNCKRYQAAYVVCTVFLGVGQGAFGSGTGHLGTGPVSADDFIEFMACRWVPESVDPVGYKHWVRNVRSLSKIVWTD